MDQICPKCNSPRIASGKIKAGLFYCLFHLPKTRFRFSIFSHLLIKLNKPAYGCINCGLIWTTVSPKELTSKIQKFIDKKELERNTGSCIHCKSNTTISGKIKRNLIGREGTEPSFKLDRLKIKLTLNTISLPIQLTDRAFACSECGILWNNGYGTVSLINEIKAFGKQDLKERLQIF